MKIRRIIVSTMLVLGTLSIAIAPAHAGLWCEQVGRVDEVVTVRDGSTGGAGGACNTAIGVVCTVAGKVSGNGGGGCLQ